jgi:hypothetical protein
MRLSTFCGLHRDQEQLLYFLRTRIALPDRGPGVQVYPLPAPAQRGTPRAVPVHPGRWGWPVKTDYGCPVYCTWRQSAVLNCDAAPTLRSLGTWGKQLRRPSADWKVATHILPLWLQVRPPEVARVWMRWSSAWRRASTRSLASWRPPCWILPAGWS